jgi:hypothetical protein
MILMRAHGGLLLLSSGAQIANGPPHNIRLTLAI